jgi:hypothetical protein
VNVLTKEQNYRLWKGGAFGNKLRQWRTLDEWEKSGFAGQVVLRYLGSAGGGFCKYNLRPGEVDAVVEDWIKAGAERPKIMVNEAAPDRAVVLQGELWNGADPWNYFLYSTVRAHMRPALERESRVSKGLATELLLRSTLTPSSYSDLGAVRERYPDHAIELSVYSIMVGDIPGRNTLIWEVRKY